MLTTCPPETRVLFVCEKASQARNMRIAWETVRPDIPFVAVLACTYHPAGFRPRLPRYLPYHEIHLVEPEYFTREDLPISSGGQTWPEEFWARDILARQALGLADILVCATDTDPRGVFAFTNLLRHMAPERADRAWPFLRLETEQREAVIQAIKHPASTRDEDFCQAIRMSEARRFFDANWAAQSLPVFEATLFNLEIPYRDGFISKYGLQLLWFLKENPAPSPFGDIVRAMGKWTGTGRYEANSGIGLGCPISRSRILEDLLRMGLIEVSENSLASDHLERLCISDRGLRFLERVHPKLHDPDLPFRLESWARSWPESRPAVERYIRTIFGRQRRFQEAFDPRVIRKTGADFPAFSA